MSRNAWPLACALLAAFVLTVQALPAEAFAHLDWQPALAAQQPWRWWSAALLHWSAWHLVANLAGLAVLAWFGWAARLPWLAVLAWFAAWPWLHLALLAWPELLHYAGLSGLLHAGVAVAATWGVARFEPQQRRIAELVGVGLVIKLLAEQPWDEPVAGTGGWGAMTAPSAHASGAVAGLVCALLALARGRGDAQDATSTSEAAPAIDGQPDLTQ